MIDLRGAVSNLPVRPDGVAVGIATPAQLPQIAELTGASIHPEAVAEVWALAAVDREQQFIVALDGDDVVATMAVLAGAFRIGGTSLPFLQPEFVATTPSHRRRGLVASMLAAVHDAADQTAAPITIVSGLEFFYRQFGYEYVINTARQHVLVDLPSGADDRWVTRTAIETDIPSLDALQDSVHQHTDLVAASSADRWKWLLKLGHRVLVAEKDGRIEAMARVYRDESGVELSETSARSVPAADAILRSVAAGGPGSISVPDRPGGGGRFLDRRTEMSVDRAAIYVRPTSARLLFESMVPILDGRLSRSSYAAWSGPIPISLYTTGIELIVGSGRIVGLRSFRPESAPPRGDEAALPPDLVAHLAFSDLGAVGLEERHADVILGEQRLVMRTLFPPITSDLLLH